MARIRARARFWTAALTCGGMPAMNMSFIGNFGAPGVTRTPDLLVRSQTLYPTELRAQTGGTLFNLSSRAEFRNLRSKHFVLNDPAPVAQRPTTPRPKASRRTAARSPGT